MASTSETKRNKIVGVEQKAVAAVPEGPVMSDNSINVSLDVSTKVSSELFSLSVDEGGLEICVHC